MEAFVQISGHVGGDVSLRKHSVPVADFRLASTPRVPRATGWTDGETTWITVKAFRSLAENAPASLRRGDPVLVFGRLRTSVWTREGVTYERLELEASTIGHDLRRGTSSFRRAERTAEPGSADPRPTAEVGQVSSNPGGEVGGPEPEDASDAA
jgi:single-strand DNA-binding protein